MREPNQFNVYACQDLWSHIDNPMDLAPMLAKTYEVTQKGMTKEV